MAQTRKVRVAAAVRAIRAFHALGRSLPRKGPHKDAYGLGVVDAAAQRHELNLDTARKARQFADPMVGYSVADVGDLCRLVKQLQPAQDVKLAVFGKTHVIRLLSVPKARRQKLQRDAVAGGWSVANLEAHIAARYGSRRDGGRKRRLPADPVGLLAQIEGLCESWRRWAAALTPASGDGAVGHATLADLPEEIRRQVRAASREVQKVQRVVTGELRKRLPKRDVRASFREDE